MRVTTWNVHFGKRAAALAQAIASNPNLAPSDIILLQEVESHSSEGQGRAERMAAILGYDCAYGAARPTRGGTHGIAILSRFPLSNIERVELPFLRMPWRSRQRIALIADVQSPEGPVTVCNVHLDVRVNHRQRMHQLRPALERVTWREPRMAIVGGDFNTSPFYFALRGLPIAPYSQRKRIERFMLRNGFQGLPSVPRTYRAPLLPMPLDHVFVAGGSMASHGVERHVRLSDHHPLWVDILPCVPHPSHGFVVPPPGIEPRIAV